jgi:hypothetical protein
VQIPRTRDTAKTSPIAVVQTTDQCADAMEGCMTTHVQLTEPKLAYETQEIALHLVVIPKIVQAICSVVKDSAKIMLIPGKDAEYPVIRWKDVHLI